MLIICFISWSSISVATPSNAKNVFGIIAARVCIGMAQGFLIPSVHTVLSQVHGSLVVKEGMPVAFG
jgi:ACS family sodium-dependent inorganic phosphate cotransporter